MRVQKIEYRNWRNLIDGTVNPCEGVNILFGDNAQGKTNLLESIWLCTGAKSFRGSRDADLIKFGFDRARITADIFSHGREQKIKYTINSREREKEIFLNNILVKTTRLCEVFAAVVFSPNHLSIIKEGPQERRRFIDTALCQLSPACARLINDYLKALSQRNSLLKDAKITENLEDMLDLFEDALARYGSELSYQRQKYIEELSAGAEEFFCGLSGGTEKIGLLYNGKVYSIKTGGAEKMRFDLKQSRSEDIRLGYTTAGPHRHDLEVTINGISAKNFGSQGQQRSAALSLKLSEASVLTKFIDQKPVALLDDVMSELDQKRQDYILNRLEGWQVFITACDPTPMKKLKAGRFFYIESGEIKNVSTLGTKYGGR